MLASRLGELLVREKLISTVQFEGLMTSLRNAPNARLVDVILAQGLIEERSLVELLSKSYRMPIMDLANFQVEEPLLKLMPGGFWQKNQMIPVGRRGETLVVAVGDPTNIQAADDLRFQTRLRVEQVLAAPTVITSLLESQLGVDTTKLDQMNTDAGIMIEEDLASVDNEAGVDDAPIIAFVTQVLSDAIRKRASDIHIEPYEKDLRIRIRIDGDLVESVKPPNSVKSALTARIKVMAKMRLDEKRLPQDGRLRLKISATKTVDFRVNSLPTVYGEKIVLRILDKSNAVVGMDQVGFEKDDLAKFWKAINEPWGICLVTGATGSGKTTTLYAALNALNKPDVNISTIEDPVEYNFHGINQTQTKEGIGLTFAETLRALLRQDPDIILLGEIRDSITAEIAFKAALTGHMVLSTLHTNDAPSAVMRLKDMGLDTFLINSALHVVVAQRLVRRICKDCKTADTRYTGEQLVKMGFPQSIIGKFQPMMGAGCQSCRNTGFKGRAAIHEVLALTDSLKEKIGASASTEEIRKHAISEGMRTIRMNCMRKIVAGACAIDELQSVGSGGH